MPRDQARRRGTARRRRYRCMRPRRGCSERGPTRSRTGAGRAAARWSATPREQCRRSRRPGRSRPTRRRRASTRDSGRCCQPARTSTGAGRGGACPSLTSRATRPGWCRTGSPRAGETASPRAESPVARQGAVPPPGLRTAGTSGARIVGRTRRSPIRRTLPLRSARRPTVSRCPGGVRPSRNSRAS